MIRPAVIARRMVGVGLPVAVALGTLLPSPASAQVDPPVPELPTPDLPTPDLPTPDLPTPDVPTPELPEAPELPGLGDLRGCVEEAVAAHDPSEQGAALVEAIMACIVDAGLPELPADVPDLPADVPELPADVPELPGGLPADVPELPADVPELPADASGGLPVQAPELPTGLPG